MYWLLRTLAGWRRRLREAEPLPSELSLTNEVFRRLTVKCWICKRRIRKREIAESGLKPALKRGLDGLGRETSLREGLRVKALEERHQIAEQAGELLDVARRRL